MSFVLKAAVALVGLLLLRGALYPRSWARRKATAWLFAFIGMALTLPLARHSPAGLVATSLLAGAVLLPYRRLAVAYMKARTRKGLRAVARRWGSRLNEDQGSGRWEVHGRLAGRPAWVGNVLTRHGSIDPRVRRSETRYMLAFVVQLSQPPPFQCSLMLGWQKPRFFEHEWRETQVIEGEYLSLAFGELGLGTEEWRATGGRIADLQPYSQLPTDFPELTHALGTRADAFNDHFDDRLAARFRATASRTLPYEFNVTPTSVNIYTTYCDAETQLANVELLERFLQRLDDRLESGHVS